MTMDNDTRGWILTGISAIACVLGACFICIDIVIRLFPGKRGFNIKDSNVFLSCSLSLSAGVMLFSALYKILPEAKNSLTSGGFSSWSAAWVLIASFLAGVWGIQLLSKLLHMCMPSQVVGCDHSHGEEDLEDRKAEESENANGNGSGSGIHESTPLLQSHTHTDVPNSRQNSTDSRISGTKTPNSNRRRPLTLRMSRTVSQLVTGEKASCSEDGPCRGYTKPCGAHCFRTMGARHGARSFLRPPQTILERPGLRRSASTTLKDIETVGEPLETQSMRLHNQNPLYGPMVHDTRKTTSLRSFAPSIGANSVQNGETDDSHNHAAPTSSPSPHAANENNADAEEQDHHNHEDQAHSDAGTHDHNHHHHVPQNAFLSLSFQTSVAIVLHKLPEGFITYASNHANPSLGFNIFMALAIHNITEGFALALPIYLATNSRAKALLYSFAMGGFSQPLGAAMAALWLKLAEKGKGDYAPSQGMYGGLFAATAGILANVALNLLSESWELTHHKGLCMFFVFVGMGILGISGALSGS